MRGGKKKEAGSKTLHYTYLNYRVTNEETMMESSSTRPWHPFRLPGWERLGLRGSMLLLCGISVIVVFPILYVFEKRPPASNSTTLTPHSLNRSKRAVTPLTFPPEGNAWYRVLNSSVRATVNSSCYACMTGKLRSRQLPLPYTACAERSHVVSKFKPFPLSDTSQTPAGAWDCMLTRGYKIGWR